MTAVLLTAACVDPGEASDDPPSTTAESRSLDPFEIEFAAGFRARDAAYFAARPLNSNAHDCVTAAGGRRRGLDGAAFSDATRAALESTLWAAADSVVAKASQWSGGWGMDPGYPHDNFPHDTVTAPTPANAAYAPQTGMAVWCLSEAADLARLLGDTARYDAYRTLAMTRNTQYASTGYVHYAPTSQATTPQYCSTCGYFWYSRWWTDFRHWVKNTNVSMALGSLVLDRRHADPASHTRGVGAASSEYYELLHGNHDYFGEFERRFYTVAPRPLEYHLSFEAFTFLHVGELLQSRPMMCLAWRLYRHYAVNVPGEPYGGRAACHFARRDPDAWQRCQTIIDLEGPNQDSLMGLVTDYWPENQEPPATLCAGM